MCEQDGMCCAHDKQTWWSRLLYGASRVSDPTRGRRTAHHRRQPRTRKSQSEAGGRTEAIGSAWGRTSRERTPTQNATSAHRLKKHRSLQRCIIISRAWQKALKET
jgi:hypothetical protein